MDFNDKTHKNFWCVLEFDSTESRAFFPMISWKTYRFRKGGWVETPITISHLRRDVYEWLREQLGPEFYEESLVDREYTKAEVDHMDMKAFREAHAVKFTDHQWCLVENRGIAFRHKDQAMMFKLRWGGNGT